MGFKARQTEMARDRVSAKKTGVRVSVYREMKAAYLDGQQETKLRPFIDSRERMGAMRCCNVNCRAPSYYVHYFLDIRGRIALCKKHGDSQIERQSNQSQALRG